MLASCSVLLGTLVAAHLSYAQQQCLPAISIDKKPQVFIMSDISNEPDDTMSFIRLLLHSDQYNITDMAAVTSTWLNSIVYPDQILNTTNAYGLVLDNLNTHSEGHFPTSEYLSSVVKSGQPVYGTAAIGKSPMSSGALHLIDVVDGLSSDDFFNVQGWGGANLLAGALAHIRSSRTQLDAQQFYDQLRVYTISDQDNTGPWIRANFPTIPYIASIHGFNQYRLAAWSGISGEEFYNLVVQIHHLSARSTSRRTFRSAL